MIVYRSLDQGGADLVFERLSFSDGHDSFCVWAARFDGDDQVTGYGGTMPQAVADLLRRAAP